MSAPEAGWRKRIYDLVWKYPGIHMRQVQRLTGADLSLVEYHLNQLQAQGAILSVSQAGYRRFFPLATTEQSLTPDDRHILGLLRQEQPFAIVMLLLERGSVQHKELVAALGISKSALSYHLQKLAKAGVIRKTPSGEERGFRLEDPDRIRRLLQHYRPTPDVIDAYGSLWEQAYGAKPGEHGPHNHESR